MRKLRINLYDLLVLLYPVMASGHNRPGSQGEVERLKRKILRRYGLDFSDIPRLRGALKCGRYRIVGGANP
jgi:hypothetical protein